MDEIKPSPIVILSGPIGAGKSTVAKELIKSATTPTVYIEGDKFWSFIIKREETSEIKKNFGATMWSMVAASVPYACNGYEVILDFTIPPFFLDSVHRITKARNVPIEYIVIKPSESICAERVANRHEGKIPDYSIYHEFYLEFAKAEKYCLSDDLGDAKAIADMIIKKRKNGDFNVVRT